MENRASKKSILHRMVFWALMPVLVLVQARLWNGEGGLAEVWNLKDGIERQQQQNKLLSLHNGRLLDEVKALKEGDVEGPARKRLRMIGPKEKFIQIYPD